MPRYQTLCFMYSSHNMNTATSHADDIDVRNGIHWHRRLHVLLAETLSTCVRCLVSSSITAGPGNSRRCPAMESKSNLYDLPRGVRYTHRHGYSYFGSQMTTLTSRCCTRNTPRDCRPRSSRSHRRCVGRSRLSRDTSSDFDRAHYCAARISLLTL